MLFLFAVSFARAATTTPTSASARPNILCLTVEDMSPWLACYGDTTAATPNIDRLAREGVRFTNAFATTPVCAPARHTIITGMYATTTGAMHMRNGQPSRQALKKDPRAYDDIPLYEAVPPPDVRCFPEFLRAAGYYCTNNAKQDYQFIAPPTAWDESSGKAHWRHRAEGQPFFAVFNCNYTHEGQGFPDAPKRSDAVKPADVKVPPFYPDTPTVRATLAQTYNNIAAMDAWVGGYLKELKDEGLLDSTIILFFSDHGVGLPRGKRNMYDTGLRVPLLARFPDGHRAGTTDDRLVSFLDFAPTMLSLASIAPRDYMKGRPFLGEVTSEAPAYVFATLDRVDVVREMLRSVSDGRYKYIRNFHPELPYLPPSAYRDTLAMMEDLYALKAGGNATAAQWQIVAGRKPVEEFYDTATDPFEITNLAGDPAQQSRMQPMREALDAWMTSTGDLGMIQPESKIVKEKLWPPDGVQPTTATPVGAFEPDATGKMQLAITCDTPGASIGFRKKGEKTWRVYVKPADVDSGDYELVGHRIGFKRSGVATVTVPHP